MKKTLNALSSVLIVKTSALGDIVQSFPILHLIKDKFPQVNIDWLVEKNGETLVSAHPFIDQTLVVDTKRWKKSPFSKETRSEVRDFFNALRRKKYDLVLDLQGNCKSGVFTFLSRSSFKVGFDITSTREWPNVLATTHRVKIDQKKPVRQQYLQLLENLFPSSLETYLTAHCPLNVSSIEEKQIMALFRDKMGVMEKKKIILLCPFATKKTKELPLNHLATFINAIDNKGRVFLICWSSEEEKRKAEILQNLLEGEAIVLPEVYSFAALQGIMEKADLVIGMDSLPLHLCGYCTKTPSFSFFGATSPKRYLPLGNHRFYQNRCPYGHQFLKTCPHIRSCKEYPCLKNIDIQGAIQSFFSLGNA